MRKLSFFMAASCAAILAAAAVDAQTMGPAPGSQGGGGIPTDGPIGRDNLSQSQFNKLIEYADQAKRLTKEDKEAGKTLEDVLAEDKATVIALVKKMPLNCEVTDAMQIAEGPAAVNGKTVNTKTYEASCTNGTGYFLVWQDGEPPYGFSCFAADATRDADVAAGKKPGTVCLLPANADRKAMGTKMLAGAGVKCTVRDYRWLGQNSTNHTEFDEFACTEGPGYIAISALPGSQIPVHVESCPKSAARGLPCKLSDNGAPPVTLKTFRDELAKRGVACDATDETMHVIGQENGKKRYVVEFQCPQKPNGLVAFIPLKGNTTPFEALDCKAAAKRGAKCTLTP